MYKQLYFVLISLKIPSSESSYFIWRQLYIPAIAGQQYFSKMGCSESINVVSDENFPDSIPKLRGKKSSNYSYLELEPSPTGMYVRSSRSKMKLQVAKDEDFLTHHLQNELCLSPYATYEKIRARQIIEHYMFNDLSHSKVGGQHTTSKLTEFALKAWFQRTFLNCIQRAQKIFFGQDISFNDVRRQLAEEYAFEIYQMGQFINAGFGKFGDGKSRVEIPLSTIILSSDSSLYPLLNKLQQKYPLVQESGNIAFPDVKPMTQNINLLNLIESKCYSDPQNLNIQNIFDDLKFLIDSANSLFHDFQSDILSLLGKEALVDCKVKSSLLNGKTSYNASEMRRVFIKWSETMIQRIPDVYVLEEFLEFITSKKKMADHFIFKSIFSQSTHNQVIHCLTILLESIKYNIASTQPRQAFGLFLYDLLRCKTTRNNGQEIVALLDMLKSTKVIPSGKRFQVVRIKNRFKSATRDILVNFRYGEHLVAQAQLCIDSPHDSAEVAKRIKFRHYLYELQRGLFGPTFQLIMQYEDFSRKDISVYLEAQGLVRARNLTQIESRIKKAGRVCPQMHEMVAIKGNIFGSEKLTALMQQSYQAFNCDFCFQLTSFGKEYHYCYYCSLFYCLRCLNVYKSTDFSKLEISCDQPSLLTPLQSTEAISAECRANKAIILIVYREGKPACRMFLDQVIYLLSTYVSQGKQVPKVYTLDIANRKFGDLVKKYKVTRLPTTLILNQEEDPEVILVGSTFHDIEGFFEVEQRIKNGLPKGIKIKCNICGEGMTTQHHKKPFEKEEKCQICMDTNKIEDLGDFVRALFCSNKDFYCQNGHMKCGYCSYLCSNQRSYFRDHTGRSYLSNKLPIKPTFCQKFHLVDIVPQPLSFTCSKCRLKIENITQEEVGYCSSCKIFICSECFSADTQSFQEREIKQAISSVEIVSHLVEDYAQESWPCGCGKMFLKVYQSRKKDNMRESALFKAIILHYQQKKWTCYVCQQQTDHLKLHLACFFCSYAQSKTNKLSHIQICLNCSIKSGLLGRRSVEEEEDVSQLKCKANHSVIKTQKRQKDSIFVCVACKQKNYSNTVRYQCQTCGFDCCLQCSPDFLVHRSLNTLKKCLNKHEMQWEKRKPGLGFCKLCSGYIFDGHFRCSMGCQYLMCRYCADQ